MHLILLLVSSVPSVVYCVSLVGICILLKKYNAKSPEDIEIMIEQGEIGEHPAYEDYLSALSYEQNIKDLKKLLNDLVKRI